MEEGFGEWDGGAWRENGTLAHGCDLQQSFTWKKRGVGGRVGVCSETFLRGETICNKVFLVSAETLFEIEVFFM